MPAKKKNKPPIKKSYLETRPDSIKRFLSAIKQGATIKLAADFAGISETAFYRYLDLGRETEDTIYHKFLLDFRKAKASLVIKHLMNINTKADDDWRASKYILALNGIVEQSKPEIEVNINLEQVDTKGLIEQLQKTEDLINLKGPVIDIDEE
tara:strand:- start:1172 stop:1630 length:459 start_codon:yes stop_codon:yes gene_type:complete